MPLTTPGRSGVLRTSDWLVLMKLLGDLEGEVKCIRLIEREDDERVDVPVCTLGERCDARTIISAP